MRLINDIVIHCSAGFGSLEKVKLFWKTKLGWENVGYHFFIDTDGTVHQLAGLNAVTNGVKGYNRNSVHICYQGGIDEKGKAKDTRTFAQKWAIEDTINQVLDDLRAAGQDTGSLRILGHRDFSPDLNGNGVIESWERIKECPCFDAIGEYQFIKR